MVELYTIVCLKTTSRILNSKNVRFILGTRITRIISVVMLKTFQNIKSLHVIMYIFTILYALLHIFPVLNYREKYVIDV